MLSEAAFLTLSTVCLNILTRGGDIQETRTIHPAPGELIRIGRASSAASKNMVAGPNNAMFDSRVMSRCHAHIEAPTGLPVCPSSISCSHQTDSF